MTAVYPSLGSITPSTAYIVMMSTLTLCYVICVAKIYFYGPLSKSAIYTKAGALVASIVVYRDPEIVFLDFLPIYTNIVLALELAVSHVLCRRADLQQ